VRLAARLNRWLPAGRYRTAGWLGRRVTGPFWARMPAELGGAWFYCDARDQIARDVCFTGAYEPQETALVRALLGPDMTFVDVGANWGYFSLLAAGRVGEHGRVLSLEPDPRLFPILQANVRRNGWRQIQPVQAAAAAETGELTLLGYQEEDGNWGLSRIGRDGENGQSSFRVAARPLDGLLDEFGFGTVDLLKMDVEGFEGPALKGLKGALGERRVRRILLELHPARLAELGHSCEQVLDVLKESGYRAWSIDHTPAATRRLSYSRHPDPREFLHPFDAAKPLDAWPHLLWTLAADPLFAAAAVQVPSTDPSRMP
jgi:FkbM family methyltransferase